MTKKKVLILGNPHERVKAYFSAHADMTIASTAEMVEEVLAKEGASFQVVISSAYMGLSSAWITRLSALEIVCNFGVGYDSTDVAALKARNIPFSNTPDVLNDAVADTTMALLLATVRQVCLADQFVRAGRWEKETFPLTPNVTGKKVGIVGLGSIGKVIAKRFTGFDCEIAYHNRHARTDVPYRYEASLPELARWADFLIVATVGGANTRHLISAEVLQALGTKGYLINIARGSVVDQEALIQALASRQIAGAGLDVFENEPFVPETLRALSNVVLMPHVGSGSIEARDSMAQLVIDNFESFYRTGELITAV